MQELDTAMFKSDGSTKRGYVLMPENVEQSRYFGKVLE